MPALHNRTVFRRVFCAVAIAAAIAGTMGSAATSQGGPDRAFGPGRCGPIDPSYVRVANATGGQPLPLGPTETGAMAPLMSASSNAETVFWATALLTPDGETITVPVDGITSRVAFVLSTDGSISDMTVVDPRGTPVVMGPGVEPFSFGCVRGLAVERPLAGEWTIRAAGTGTSWLIVHARSDLELKEAAFVQVAGQPVAGRPATLRARITRMDITDVTFDLVSMSGARLQTVELSPITPSGTEEEHLGEIATLPRVPFRVRVFGRDRTGAVYQRVSRPAFHAATVEIEPPQTTVLTRGQQSPVTVTVTNVGAPTQLHIVAVLDAQILRAEPDTVLLNASESRDVTVWPDVPVNSTSSFAEIIVTAESPTDPAAANSVILRATLEPIQVH